MNPLRVLVLAGGESGERDVSLNSARAIVAGLQKRGHQVQAIDTGAGRSLLDSDGLFLSACKTNELSRVSNQRELANYSWLTPASLNEVDVVFLALHGGAGEDGALQGLLDFTGKPYTGSGRVASSVCMIKPLTKRVAQSLSIPTPPWIDLRRGVATFHRESVAALGYPVIVKPADGGSTLGLTLVKDDSTLEQAIADVFAQSSHCLIEKYIAGRELTVAVFENEAWPIVEIKPKSGLYDYTAKYTKGGSEYVCPAVLPEQVAKGIGEYAATIYSAVGCAGLARIDFMLDTDMTPYFLEVNTLPGMTELSLAPMSAKAAGHSFEELLEMMIKAALSKSR